MTMEHEKHVFSSFISRDTTFKLMTRLWKRAMRDLGAQEACIVSIKFSLTLLRYEFEQKEGKRGYLSTYIL